MIVAVLFVVNAVLSWWNARACGRVWDVSAANGGYGYLLTWCAAVMAACGFMWCLLIPTGLIAASIPMQMFADDGEVLTGMLLNETDLEAFFGLGYLVMIFPMLGSGLGITIESWHNLMEKRAAGNANGWDYAATGWNTLAQVHNTASAFQNVPNITGKLADYFKGSENLHIRIVIAMVAFCTLGGILLTYGIIQHYRAEVRREYRFVQA